MRRMIIAMILFGSTILATAVLLNANHTRQETACVAVFNGIQSQVCPQPESEEQVNWFAWAQFKSKSAQLHFLDLVELIFGSEPPQNVSRGNLDEQSLNRR
ncbi:MULTISPECIES: hypothetical protein [Gammaproteobacteria]|uniref:hypothetical protein n=1 Tax=Gammaproteobacteria TaxID=1236 RepID=UPI000DD07ECC|nr:MULTISPECIES: hypothetical protein [Gammaproteobacteria]RTE85720.1 hypothetical protein DQX04_09725 [Aliidiomarina sp. B3213]TCZ90278.1 hypothetical protein EYQ95_10730 [Lysobacter sp. N42]